MSNDDGKTDWSKFGDNNDWKKMNNMFEGTGDKTFDLPDPYEFLKHDKVEMLPVHNPTYDLIEIQEESNKLLGKIVDNTSVLKELVEINRKTQLNTEELKDVLAAIHEVSKAKNKDEADNIFKKALNTINASGETVENIARLVNLLMGLYNTVQLLNSQYYKTNTMSAPMEIVNNND